MNMRENCSNSNLNFKKINKIHYSLADQILDDVTCQFFFRNNVCSHFYTPNIRYIRDDRVCVVDLTFINWRAHLNSVAKLCTSHKINNLQILQSLTGNA